MTPDELRRMDNDLCIIFEKGIKPVKANKFYYFKHKGMASALKRSEISHNDASTTERGAWRKFNPYNPWTEDQKENDAKNLKVESLDDLFEDEPKKEEKVESIKKEEPVVEKSQTIDELFDDISTNQSSEEKPIEVPTAKYEEEEDTYDLQKELEAKFDELFGPMDE